VEIEAVLAVFLTR